MKRTASQAVNVGELPVTPVDPNLLQEIFLKWRQAVEYLYLEWETRTYCVPPVIFKRVQYRKATVSGVPALEVQLDSQGHHSTITTGQSDDGAPHRLCTTSGSTASILSTGQGSEGVAALTPVVSSHAQSIDTTRRTNTKLITETIRHHPPGSPAAHAAPHPQAATPCIRTSQELQKTPPTYAIRHGQPPHHVRHPRQSGIPFNAHQFGYQPFRHCYGQEMQQCGRWGAPNPIPFYSNIPQPMSRMQSPGHYGQWIDPPFHGRPPFCQSEQRYRVHDSWEQRHWTPHLREQGRHRVPDPREWGHWPLDPREQWVPGRWEQRPRVPNPSEQRRCIPYTSGPQRMPRTEQRARSSLHRSQTYPCTSMQRQPPTSTSTPHPRIQSTSPSPQSEATPPKQRMRAIPSHQSEATSSAKHLPAQSVPCSMWPLDSQPESKLASVSESDNRDDCAQQHVLSCLHKLGKDSKEPMFIISQLNFSDYLNKPSYAATAAMLPRPERLLSKDNRGDFDALLIHRYNGVMIGEIKSIGLNDNIAAVSDYDLSKRVRKACEQLEKSEKILKYILSDIVPDLLVHKTLILPYITRSKLRQILTGDDNLKEELRKCLDAQNCDDALSLCLSSEDLSARSAPWDVTPSVLLKLKSWWQRRMTCNRVNWSSSLYLDIIARFVGPATTVSVHCVVLPRGRVEVRTEGEAVSEVGNRLAQVVLTPQQVELVNNHEQTVCLTGPPGTGKTVVLVLKALRWLRQGHDVHIISGRFTSRAVSFQIRHQLRMTLEHQLATMPSKAGQTEPRRFGEVHLLFYDIYLREEDISDCLSALKNAAEVGGVFAIMDEVHPSHRVAGPRFHQLIDAVCTQIPNIHLWIASVTKRDVPACLQEKKMTVPLRCAQVVLREVKPGVAGNADPVDSYSMDSRAVPCDGQEVITLQHSGANHSGQWPVECQQCGRDVAARLFHLGVGAAERNPGNGTATCAPQLLQYRDVFVLTRNTDLHDSITDNTGNTKPASGFVLGLRSQDIPVCVIRRNDVDEKDWEKKLKDIAKARTNEVVATVWGQVCGLERKVVVFLRGRAGVLDENKSDEDVDAQDRLYAVSRCTTQLIVVEVPRDSQE